MVYQLNGLRLLQKQGQLNWANREEAESIPLSHSSCIVNIPIQDQYKVDGDCITAYFLAQLVVSYTDVHDCSQRNRFADASKYFTSQAMEKLHHNPPVSLVQYTTTQPIQIQSLTHPTEVQHVTDSTPNLHGIALECQWS